MSRKVYAALLAMSFSTMFCWGQKKPVEKILDISDQYSVFNTADFKEKAVFINGTDTLHADKYWEHFKMIRDSEFNDGQFVGRIGFGFNGNDSPNDDLYEIQSAINIRAGTFPHQLKIDANFNFIDDDGRISENVSNISLAFDHHPKTNRSDKLARENFVFLKRFTDKFMQVNQRYEVGAGAIFANGQGN